MTDKTLHDAALEYHAKPTPGKISIELTKPADTSHDLTLAYTPGVAEPVREIYKNPEDAYKYTIKGNLVAVITNGTAILGLGNLGPLASKPVMEGKSLLFKRFANVDSIDIEVEHQGVDDFVNTVANISCTFGGINLEDIKAPECFEIEEKLKKRCNIPVFHDDQHGTAIVTTAGMLNALQLQGKKIEDCRVVCIGAGAAGIACSTFLQACGAKPENFFMIDRHGVIRSERTDLNDHKRKFVNDSGPKTLAEAMEGADALLGVSGPNLVTKEEVMSMAPKAVILACSNPDPEVSPSLVQECRPDIIFGTGRSDYPNQINNVICFPFLFRGALDVRATEINLEMKKAAMNAIRLLAQEPVPDEVAKACGEEHLEFGPHYIMPKPVDHRLYLWVSKAVAEAAVRTGAARAPLPDHYLDNE